MLAPNCCDAELPPRHDAELPPRHDAELPPHHDAELLPRHDAELPPRCDAELPPRHDAELPPRHDAELPPRRDAELPSRRDAELLPRRDAELPSHHMDSESRSAKRNRDEGNNEAQQTLQKVKRGNTSALVFDDNQKIIDGKIVVREVTLPDSELDSDSLTSENNPDKRREVWNIYRGRDHQDRKAGITKAAKRVAAKEIATIEIIVIKEIINTIIVADRPENIQDHRQDQQNKNITSI